MHLASVPVDNRISRLEQEVLLYLLSGEEITVCIPMDEVWPNWVTMRSIVELARKGFITVEPKDKSIPPPPPGGFYAYIFDQEAVITKRFIESMGKDDKTLIIKNDQIEM